MKKYIFTFYLNGHLTDLTIIAKTMTAAENLICRMFPNQYFDDGLFLRIE